MEVEKTPTGAAWQQSNHDVTQFTHSRHVSGWTRGRYFVISELVDTEMPDGSGDMGPSWHVSISKRGARVRDSKVIRKMLRDFGMLGAEEDNHEPGEARNFWLVVDPMRRVDCECKTDETLHREANGQVWSSHVDPEKCGGCLLAQLMPGRTCPVHAIDG